MHLRYFKRKNNNFATHMIYALKRLDLEGKEQQEKDNP